MVKDPQAHIMTPAQYMQQVCEKRIPVMDNHKPLESIAEKTKDLPKEEQPLITVLEFRDFQRPPPPLTLGPSQRQ